MRLKAPNAAQLVDVRLKSPFTALIVGPTGSGKMVTTFKLISERENVCTEPPIETHYCYGAWQESFERLSGDVIFHKGLIDVE